MTTTLTWTPTDEAQDFAIVDRAGTYLFPIPHMDGRVLTSEAGTLTSTTGTAKAYASARLIDHALSQIPLAASVDTVAHSIEARARRVAEAHNLVSQIGPVPARAGLTSLDSRSRVEAHLVDALMRGLTLDITTTVDILEAVGLSASPALCADRLDAGLYNADELGAALDQRAAEDADTAQRAATAHAERIAADTATTPTCAGDIGADVVFLWQASETTVNANAGPDMWARVTNTSTGALVKTFADNSILKACRTVGLSWPAQALVARGNRVFLRVCPADERFDLTKSEREKAALAPVLVGRGALYEWRDVREVGREMTDADFLTPRTKEWKAALAASAKVLDALVPVYLDGSVGLLPIPQTIVRGLCLPPDVAAREIANAFKQRGAEGNALFGSYELALPSCLEAARTGFVQIGELFTEKDPGLLRRVLSDPCKDAVREAIAGRDFIKLDDIFVIMQTSGDRQKMSNEWKGRVRALMASLGWEYRDSNREGRGYHRVKEAA